MTNVVMLAPAKDVEKVRRACAFFAKDGAGLLTMLELVGEFDAAAAVLDLAKRDCQSRTDVQHVRALLEIVLDALDNLPFQVVDHVARAGLGPRDLHAALRWYGARVEQQVKDMTA